MPAAVPVPLRRGPITMTTAAGADYTEPTRIPVGAATFRDLMSVFPSGVTVVTTRDDDGAPRGLTCTALCSVSLSPPMLLVCLQRGSGTLTALLARGAFAINLLHAGGRKAAEVFADAGGDRFSKVEWDETPRWRLPRLSNHSHAVAECRVVRCVDAGDHAIVLGEVEDAVSDLHAPPLIYGRRQYTYLQ